MTGQQPAEQVPSRPNCIRTTRFAFPQFEVAFGDGVSGILNVSAHGCPTRSPSPTRREDGVDDTAALHDTKRGLF